MLTLLAIINMRRWNDFRQKVDTLLHYCFRKDHDSYVVVSGTMPNDCYVLITQKVYLYQGL